MAKQASQKKAQTASPKKEIPLFREEVLKRKKGSYFGKAVIISPISFSTWSLGIFVIAVMLGCFLYFGKYAKRQEVIGMLVPNKGLIHVYATQPGVVAEKFVQQGEQVAKGQLLYRISTEHHTLSEQSTTAQQGALLEKQLVVQKEKLAMVVHNLERYKQLLEQKVIAETEYQKLYEEYLNVELAIHEAEKNLIQIKAHEDYTIRAPDDGTISALVAMAGDRVVPEKPLATIVPNGAILQGVLFVRSNAIGFVKVGQKVLLKYDAYPYQNFGLYGSTVTNIDKSILFPSDIKLEMNINPNAQIYGGSEPFYRVIVDLKQQTVNVYGKPQQLTAGMTLRGSILGDERRIWQWIMDPVYSLRGSLTSS